MLTVFPGREAGSYGYPPSNNYPNTQWELIDYPFLTAEYGGGAGVMYRRRVVLSLPDDVAATIPVQLGSGVNLYGYYMFHGTTNPRGKTETLQESTATGGYNDLPIFEYDYEAPIGQYGEQRVTLNRIKLYHYWLNGFGDQLAGMSMRQPEVTAENSTDLSSLRWSVRSNGESGYLFLNNYVRQYSMKTHTDIQFAVKFTSGTVTFPSEPITIPDGAYFVWPLNLSLGRASLISATAQLMTSLNISGRTIYIFVATDDIPVEFAFDSTTVSKVKAVAGITNNEESDRILVKSIIPDLDLAIYLTDKGGDEIGIIVLNQTTADNLWELVLGGQKTLILTEQALSPSSDGFQLTNPGSPDFSFATFPAIDCSVTTREITGATELLLKGTPKGLFTVFESRTKSKNILVTTQPFQAPGIAPPILKGGQAGGALEPNQTAIVAAQGLWTISIPWSQVADVDDAWLMIDYEGDLARLYAGNLLLDDNFYDGTTWVVGLKRFASTTASDDLTIAIMPLRSDAPIYLQAMPQYDSNGQACSIINVNISTVYHLNVKTE
ncbi:hypothetical protein N7510_002659 [Penicillium lagena]|uniref:uncharacterized protein n=1 Tax=Penicillium lagena TaxID=94218 RepID=UPI002541FFA5|nr:uncharacterized protein N7510_002659 [Penicillium lagena]KAJ5626350.1 hypothetical protein N7510_002659 [Penicillium lagena]